MRRIVVAVVATFAGLSAPGCAGDVLGGDCVMDGVARIGRESVPSLSVACELPADSWIVAFPGDVEPQRIPALPREFWPVVDESAKEGYNWCVSTGGHGTSNGPGAMRCTYLPLYVEQAIAVRGRTFVVELRRFPDGMAVLRSLTAPTR